MGVRISHAISMMVEDALIAGVKRPVIRTSFGAAQALAKALREDVGFSHQSLILNNDGSVQFGMYDGVAIIGEREKDQDWRNHFGELAEIWGG